MVKQTGSSIVYMAEVIFASGLAFCSGNFLIENFNKWNIIIARYVFYLLLIEAFHEVCLWGYRWIKNKWKMDYKKLLENSKKYSIFLVSLILLLYSGEHLFDENFIFIYIGYLITKYPEMDKPTSINYGVGMACSFFEGYLVHILPSDGAKFVGFEENIILYQNRQNVVFPVKKLFIVITKSLYCPPDLKEFNKKDQSFPYLEACQSLEDVEKSVAGVTHRKYTNSAYKIHRSRGAAVYLAAECATPLHTLHRVLRNRAVHAELGNIDVEEVVGDFCATLATVVRNSPECRGKCELVHFDDTDPNQNLAEVLLERIREIEPQFESITRK